MNLARNIAEILDEEYRILTRGDYAALQDLTERKESLERQLRETPEKDNQVLAALAGAAARNAELIDAARRGFEQARVQIREIRDGMTQATYGRSGVRRPLAQSPNRIEQKL